MNITKENVHTVCMKKNFFKCGIAGLCLEVVWTSITNSKPSDRRLIGNTSLWMFPIYGMAAAFAPMSKFIRKRHVVVRGGIYTACIYLVEFVTGLLLKRKKCCPWDYSKSKFNIKGVIRLDYAPLWFGLGLFFEKFLTKEMSGIKYVDIISKADNNRNMKV